MSDEAVVLREERTDGIGSFVTEWMCDPPDEGVTYRIVSQEWHDDFGRQVVWEWEPVG